MGSLNLDLSKALLFEKSKGVKTYTYRDIGTGGYRLSVDRMTGEQTVSDVKTSAYDLDAIKNSIRNIFLFVPGQRILNPEFGCTLYRYLYEPMDDMLKDNIRHQINRLIGKYQPRIDITSISIEETGQHEYSIQIKYQVPELGKSSAEILTLSPSSGIEILSL